MKTLLAALVLAAVLGSAGCSVRNYALNSLGDALAGAGAGFGTDDDAELIRAAAPFSLKLMEGVLVELPSHGSLLAATSSGFTQYTYAFVQQEADEAEARDLNEARAMRDRARRLYTRARDYGLRALESRYPGFHHEFRRDPVTALERLSKQDSGALYWTAVAWASSIALAKDSPVAISELRLVDAMVARLRALAADYENGALHSFLISYEMARPGAREAEAKALLHFAEAVRLSSGLRAAPYVAFAESVCVAAQDRREFVDMLNQALAVDLAAAPQWRLENAVMQRRARWLLSQIDQLFIEQGASE